MAADGKPPASKGARTGGRLATAVGVLLLLAALASWRFDSEVPSEPSATPAMPAPLTQLVWPPVAAASAIDEPPPVADSTTSEHPERPEQLELCGGLWVKVDADGKPFDPDRHDDQSGNRRRV